MISRHNSVIHTVEVVDLAVVPKSCMHTMLASARLQESSSLHTKPVRPSSVVSLTNPSYSEEPWNIKVTAFFWAAVERLEDMFICNVFHIAPGQQCMLHFSVMAFSPMHSVPLQDGAGLVQVRVRFLIPPPQVTEHSCGHQSVHPPSTTNKQL